MPSRVAGRRAYNAVSPSLHWVQEGLFPPLQRYDQRLRLPAAPLAALRCLHLAIPPLRRMFALLGRRRVTGGSGELVIRFPSRRSRWKRRGLPGSWGTLMIIARALRPQQDRPRSVGPRETRPTRPPLMTTTKTPGDFRFRGSITRPLTWLWTLRGEGHPSPRKTRFWRLARLCQAGWKPAGFRSKVSEFEALSPFPSFPGARTLLNGVPNGVVPGVGRASELAVTRPGVHCPQPPGVAPAIAFAFLCQYSRNSATAAPDGLAPARCSAGVDPK